MSSLLRSTSSATGEASIATHRRPSRAATAAVVPLPQNRSSTRSPGLLEDNTMRSSSASGFWVL